MLTLAESLHGAGYRTGAFIGAFVLDRQYGFAQGFDVFDAVFPGYRAETKQSAQRMVDEVVAPANAWIKAAPAGTPWFAWVHLYDAHTPYAAPPPIGRSSPRGRMTARSRMLMQQLESCSRR